MHTLCSSLRFYCAVIVSIWGLRPQDLMIVINAVTSAVGSLEDGNQEFSG